MGQTHADVTGRLFPLKVRRIAFEPLSEHHVPEYITAWLDSLDGKAPQGFLRTSTGLISSRLLAGLGLRRLFRGHSTYVSVHALALDSVTESRNPSSADARAVSATALPYLV